MLKVQESDSDKENTLSKEMNRLIHDFDYDFSEAVHPFQFSFFDPVPVPSAVGHRQHKDAVEILGQARKDGGLCYVIAETGEWLVKELEGGTKVKQPSRLRIILSDYRNDPLNSLHRITSDKYPTQLVQMFDKRVRLLDFHLNKHHGTFTQKKCIYFYKEGKTPTLQPLVLENTKDTNRLMDLCEYLWTRARVVPGPDRPKSQNGPHFP